MTTTLHAEVPLAAAGRRLDQTLAELFPDYSRARLAAWVRGGRVRVDASACNPSQRLRGGERVELDLQPDAAVPDAPEPIALRVLHADADLLVLDKPAGLVTHPGAGRPAGTLQNALLHFDAALCALPRAGIVHRLDKDTSGLLVVARTAAAYESLVEQLSARGVERRYLALVWGHPESASGLIDAPIGRSARDPTLMAVTADGREARTRYELVARYTEPAELCLLRCRLETGRTHQIRVHLAAIGHPAVGDSRYSGKRQPLEEVSRVFLHAEHLAFEHPRSGRLMQFDSDLPAELRAVLDRLT